MKGPIKKAHGKKGHSPKPSSASSITKVSSKTGKTMKKVHVKPMKPQRSWKLLPEKLKIRIRELMTSIVP